jgi:hypothetical protein
VLLNTSSTIVGANLGPNTNQPSMSFMIGLNLLDLNKFINDYIHHDPNWSNMPNKLPSDIPKFKGNVGEDPSNHIMSFHLSCSNKFII